MTDVDDGSPTGPNAESRYIPLPPTAGLGAAIVRLLDEHWPDSRVNGWYLADLLRDLGVSLDDQSALAATHEAGWISTRARKPPEIVVFDADRTDGLDTTHEAAAVAETRTDHALIERVRAAEAEWRETAVKFSDDYHAELDKRIEAEAAVARVEALMRMLEEEAAPYIFGGSRHEAASDAITALADVRAETAQRLRSALTYPPITKRGTET